MESEKSRHHLNFCRREWASDNIANRIRNHPGMIVQLDNKVHKDLHANIEPIKPPYRTLGLVVLNSLKIERTKDPRYAVPDITNFLWNLAVDDSRLGHEAFRFAHYYDMQMRFLGMGKYEELTEEL